MIKVVLLDFHNTLATCDGWLELEIKTLPGLALQKLAGQGLVEGYAPALSDQANAVFRQLRQRVRESGREVSAVDGTLEVLGEMGLRVPRFRVEQAVADLEHACLPEVKMLPGADHALRLLHDASYTLGVVSSAGYPPFVELSLEAIGLRSYFSEVITSAGEQLYKSDPELYRRAVARLGASPQEAVHIGDHPAFDVEAAQSAGLRAIWFVACSRHTAELRGEPWYDPRAAKSSVDAIVDSMSELFDAVRKLDLGAE